MKRFVIGLAALAIPLAGCESAGELLVSATMSGDWKGEALCYPGIKLDMRLTLQYFPGGETLATNEVRFLGDEGRTLSTGEYALRGTYDVATYKLSLQPVEWTKPSQIPGAQMAPIETELRPETRTMSVGGSQACQAFVLSKS